MKSFIVVLAILLFPMKQDADAGGSTRDNNFVLYGRVDIDMELQNSFVCTHVLAVEIGNHKWRQQLKWKIYAFKVPQSMFGSQMIGVLSVDLYRHHKFVKSLWRRYFVVEGKEEEPDPEYSNIQAYPLALVLPGDTSNMARPVFSDNGIGSRCQFTCHEELPMLLSLPGTSMETKTHLSSLWHILILAFATARLMMHLVFHLLEMNKVKKSVVECCRGEEFKERKRWEMSTLRGSDMKKKKVVLASGEGKYEEAWADAEHHLGKMGMECCFYFNCSEINKFQSEGQWNRDSFGRLIRQ